MTSTAATADVEAGTSAPGFNRRLWLVGAVTLHLLGLLAPVVGYLGWYQPAQQQVSDRELELIGTLSSVCWEYVGLSQDKDFEESEQGRRAEAFAYRIRMRELFPRYAAWFSAITSSELRSAARVFTIWYGAGACVAFIGLVGSFVLGSGLPGFRSGAACGVLGVIWGAGVGVLADSFPFEVVFLSLNRTIADHSGLIGGATAFGVAGLILGWLTALVANRRSATNG